MLIIRLQIQREVKICTEKIILFMTSSAESPFWKSSPAALHVMPQASMSCRPDRETRPRGKRAAKAKSKGKERRRERLLRPTLCLRRHGRHSRVVWAADTPSATRPILACLGLYSRVLSYFALKLNAYWLFLCVRGISDAENGKERGIMSVCWKIYLTGLEKVRSLLR